MTDFEDPQFVVNFTGLGRQTSLVNSYSIQSDYLASTDGFSFELYDDDRAKLQGLELESVELIVNGHSQLIGRIDRTTIGDNGSAVMCEGRDWIADTVECNVDPTVKIPKGEQLQTAVLRAGDAVGINTIAADDFALRDVRTGKRVGAKPIAGIAKQAAEDLKPKSGEGVYEFLNRMVARFRGTIQPGPSRGQPQLAAPNYDQDPIAEITVSDSSPSREGNTVVSARAIRDYSTVPTFSLFTGQFADPGKQKQSSDFPVDMVQLAAEFGGELAATMAKCFRGRRLPFTSGDLPDGQLYRLLYFRDEASRSSEQLKAAALRAIAERLKDTLVYTCTLRGHADPFTGALWSIDTIVTVRDEIRNVNEDLWVSSRRFAWSKGAGSTTELVLWRKGVFQL